MRVRSNPARKQWKDCAELTGCPWTGGILHLFLNLGNQALAVGHSVHPCAQETCCTSAIFSVPLLCYPTWRRCATRKSRKREATSRPHRGHGYVEIGRPCSSGQRGGTMRHDPSRANASRGPNTGNRRPKYPPEWCNFGALAAARPS